MLGKLILVDQFILMAGMLGKSIVTVLFARMVQMLGRLRKMERFERMAEILEAPRVLIQSMLLLFSSLVCLIPINFKNYHEQIWCTILRSYL
jgi:heme/copper-type cytochrome/quinol oxidase subunit 3